MKKMVYLFPLLILLPMQLLAETRVAVLISGYGNETQGKISYDLEELAQSYIVLTNNGIAVDIISPKGGAVPVHNKKDDLAYIQQFKSLALTKLNSTFSAKEAMANDYQGLMIIGGDGAMFDLPVDENAQQFIATFTRSKQPIAAVCHGPAALINQTLENGEFFLKGKYVNSFTWQEELAFSSDMIDSFPFKLQQTIEERGARFVSNSPMLPFVAVDGQLITAQNPISVAKAADTLVLKLGQTPKTRTAFSDEATMALISQAKAEGEYLIDLTLATSPQNIDLNYLALYGFYAYNLAQTREEKLVELRIMAKIAEHFYHPSYAIALIQALKEQGFEQQAKEQLNSLLAKEPEIKLPEGLRQL